MKNGLFTLFIIFAGILSSCKSNFNVSVIDDRKEKITNKNFKELNGYYSNLPEKSAGEIRMTPHNYHPNPLTVSLSGYYYDKTKSIDTNFTKNTYVELKFLTQKRLQLRVVKNDSLIEEKIVKGKLKNGYFYSRQKKRIYPIYPIVFGYHFQRFRIGKYKDYIVLDYLINSWVGGMTGESSNGKVSGIFKKLNSKKRTY